MAFCLSFGSVQAAAPDLSAAFFNNAQSVIVFLGDSITHNGGYIKALQAALLLKYPGMKAKFVNAGVSGENLTKLMVRLDSVLKAEKPDLVFSSYGMNDGGYNPMSEDRFKTYRDLNVKLAATVRKTGSEFIYMTSTPFDSLTAVPLIVDQPPYGFKQFYRNFDSVLTAYGDFLLGLRSPDQMVIDLQRPMRAWAREQRLKDPKYAWTAEGVHPIDEAQKQMGKIIYDALFSPAAIVSERAAPAARPLRFTPGLFLLNGAAVGESQRAGAWREDFRR